MLLRRAAGAAASTASACLHAPPPPCTRQASTWLPAAAARFFTPAAEAALEPAGASAHAQPAPPASHAPHRAGVDPFAFVSGELDAVSERMRAAVTSRAPALSTAAAWLLRREAAGKRLRPAVLLLVSSALADAPPPPGSDAVDAAPPHVTPTGVRRRQQRVAEVAELIHVASLLHDDVLDDAATRRGLRALNAEVGNKLAILAGDFLLARASVTLASLREPDVIMLLSTVIEHLVTGEVMQMTARPEELTSFEHYAAKTHFKTASLIALSCKAVALLGSGGDVAASAPHAGGAHVLSGAASPQQRHHAATPAAAAAAAEAAYQYGRHLGLAFQYVDDVLDLTGTPSLLGKPALSDLRGGIATAAVLHASLSHPPLVAAIGRRFKLPGDVEAAVDAVSAHGGVAAARALAADHSRMARDALRDFPPPACDHAAAAREGLEELTHRVLQRTK